MFNVFKSLVDRAEKPATDIMVISKETFQGWFKEQDDNIKMWVASSKFKGNKGQILRLPNINSNPGMIVYGCGKGDDFSDYGEIFSFLDKGVYKLRGVDKKNIDNAVLGWLLSAYKYKLTTKKIISYPKLLWPQNANRKSIVSIASAVCMIRDLINAPPNMMGPEDLEEVGASISQEFGASYEVITQDLEENYPCIYAVGKGGVRKPRLLKISWGKKSNPKLVLVGKGVCFDTGGINLKSSTGLKLMKKDMAGAAHALGLAQMIMRRNLKVNLEVIIPAVDNVLGKDSYMPSDVIEAKNGTTIEVSNTDAEGRLILADALIEADSKKPDLIIDFASLTGATKQALGTDIPALFSNKDEVAEKIIEHGKKQKDILWHMPLWEDYKQYIKGKIADLSNISSVSGAGAITGALFLQEFVSKETPWVHIDLYGWNQKSSPARPEGGEAQSIRAVFSFLEDTYS